MFLFENLSSSSDHVLLSEYSEESEKEKVKETVLGIYQAFEKLDAERLDENFAHSEELLAFGTDQDEKFQGWDQYKDVHTVQFKALKSFKFTSKELEVHLNDDVAWIADRPHWNIQTRSGDKIDNDMRITAVLKREPSSGKWLVVQWHVSMGLQQKLHDY